MADVDPENDPALNPNYPSNAPWHGNSGQGAVIGVWNGGALASEYGTHGALLVFGGGHAGYYGSEVYAFDLGSRQWRRASQPYTGSISWPYASTTYPDGSPVPPHTYDYVDYHPATNSFVLMRGISDGYRPTADTGIAIAHLLDLDTGRWRHSKPNNGLRLQSGGMSCYDRNRDAMWIMGPSSTANAFSRFDPNTTNADGTVGTYTNYPGGNIEIDAAAECDPVNDIFVYTMFRYAGKVYARDLKNPSVARVVLNETGDIPVKDKANGWAWSDKRQAFLYWRRGAGVYEFKLVEGDWATGTWRWTNLTASANSVAPADMKTDNGIYSRFRIARFGNEEVAIVINGNEAPVYAFRIPDGPASGSAVSVSLSASPRAVASNGSSTLSWSATNATTCTASGNWSGARATSGSVTVGPLSATSLFTLECTGGSGSVGRATVEVGVDVAGGGNSTPSISGSPGNSVTAGSAYTFTPSAQDADGDPLTFSIQNRPDWANFDPQTGTLSGTPTSADVGTTSGIIVTVSDGTSSLSLPSFSINVVSQGTYGGTLSWIPPSSSSDGSALTDLAGYRIYYGTQSRAYSQSIRVDNPGLTSYQVDGLAAGTYYFSVVGFDLSNNESSKSNEVKAVLGITEGGGSTGGGSTGGSGTGGSSGGGTTDGGTTGSTGGISALGLIDLVALGGLLAFARRRGTRVSAGHAVGGRNETIGVDKMRLIASFAMVTAVACFGIDSASADDVDFQRRCSAPGVLKCVGFDGPADAAPGAGIYKAGDGQYHASIDASVRASGSGSLRFDILPFSGQNSSGYWLGDLGKDFGQGDHFYVQWRQRFSRTMLETDFEGGSGWKQIILHRDGPSCANVQVVILNSFQRGVPVGYSHCGATGYGFGIEQPNGDHLIQQGDYHCLRRSLLDEDCAKYAADQWITFYLDIQIGTFGQPDSRINAYIGYEGQPMKKFIERNDYRFVYDDGPSDTFRKVQLTPYHTDKSSAQDHPAAYTWYDELIVSTQPIAGPDGSSPPPSTADTVPPAAPAGLTFSP